MFRVPKHLFSIISLQRYKKFLKLPNFAQTRDKCAAFAGYNFITHQYSTFCFLLTFSTFSLFVPQILLPLHHRLLARQRVSGRSYIWERRFRTSVVVTRELRKLQTTTDRWQPERLRGAFLYTFIIYSSCWRGLTALSILCGVAMRRPTSPG